MLTAILHGKAGRVLMNNESLSWRQVFKQREDLLTAVFFGRFQYLSTDMRQFALSLLVGNKANDLGDIIAISHWPSFQLAPEDGGNTVEPDLLMECEHGVILIEVKPEWSAQYLVQWERQIKAISFAIQQGTYFETSPDTVHFVAVGSSKHLNCKKEMEKLAVNVSFSLEGHQIEWQEIFKQITHKVNIEEKSDKSVIRDWIEALNLFDIRQPIEPLKKYLSLDMLDTNLITIWSTSIVPHRPWLNELTIFPNKNILEENYDYFKRRR